MAKKERERGGKRRKKEGQIQTIALRKTVLTCARDKTNYVHFETKQHKGGL